MPKVTPQKISEYALAALMASHRDASWVADAALDYAKTVVFNHREYGDAMALATKAGGLRDAIAERIAIMRIVMAHDPEVCGNVVQAQYLFRVLEATSEAQRPTDGGNDAPVH